ncbi:hypothetical protein BC941DRAFT_446525 [Chlamydoabsidia padenii]|nr:hypothetical protein BC941DRAFT_446525 [Chlamydoabsidia padenii]
MVTFGADLLTKQYHLHHLPYSRPSQHISTITQNHQCFIISERHIVLLGTPLRSDESSIK